MPVHSHSKITGNLSYTYVTQEKNHYHELLDRKTPKMEKNNLYYEKHYCVVLGVWVRISK